jgi:hypothetical protein
VPKIDDPLLAPLEAMAAILVQHSEVIVAGYTVEAGAVVIADLCTLAAKASIIMNPDPLTPKDSVVVNPDTTLTSIQDSDVPDSIVKA